MLPSAIVTIRELILWEYARLMAEEVVGNRNNWLFTLHSFGQLDSGKKWRRTLGEEVRMDPNKCAYCGSKEDLAIARIVPSKMCQSAEFHNVIRACRKCILSKGDKDLLAWIPPERRENIRREILARYLKILYICHECSGSLDNLAIGDGGKRELVQLGYIFREPCGISKKSRIN